MNVFWNNLEHFGEPTSRDTAMEPISKKRTSDDTANSGLGAYGMEWVHNRQPERSGVITDLFCSIINV